MAKRPDEGVVQVGGQSCYTKVCIVTKVRLDLWNDTLRVIV